VQDSAKVTRGEMKMRLFAGSAMLVEPVKTANGLVAKTYTVLAGVVRFAHFSSAFHEGVFGRLYVVMFWK
jgi:hypothetical protein